MASAVWKGTLSFGLLAIPVKLYTAARSQRMNLHQLHKVCHTRLKQPLFLPAVRPSGRPFRSRARLRVRKRQIRPVINEDEIKKITPRSSTVMEIVAFVKQEQIDPIYFDASYFMIPDKESEKPYALLLKTLEDPATGRDRHGHHAPARIHGFHSPTQEWPDDSHHVLRQRNSRSSRLRAKPRKIRETQARGDQARRATGRQPVARLPA